MLELLLLSADWFHLKKDPTGDDEDNSLCAPLIEFATCCKLEQIVNWTELNQDEETSNKCRSAKGAREERNLCKLVGHNFSSLARKLFFSLLFSSLWPPTQAAERRLATGSNNSNLAPSPNVAPLEPQQHYDRHKEAKKPKIKSNQSKSNKTLLAQIEQSLLA